MRVEKRPNTSKLHYDKYFQFDFNFGTYEFRSRPEVAAALGLGGGPLCVRCGCFVPLLCPLVVSLGRSVCTHHVHCATHTAGVWMQHLQYVLWRGEQA